jgi:hypothetical protein
MKIATGIPLLGGAIDPQGAENQSYNTLFDANSTNLTSQKIDVSETPIIVKAFGLSGGETIQVNMLSNTRLGIVTQALQLNSKLVQLSVNNTALVIDLPGSYTFTLSAGLGTVVCVFAESGMGLWSVGLKAFAYGV